MIWYEQSVLAIDTGKKWALKKGKGGELMERGGRRELKRKIGK
jgi:hypothetical protein